MSKGILNIKNIIIVLLIIVILLLNQCRPKVDPEVKITTVETLRIDTVEVDVPKYTPVPGPKIFDTVFVPRDVDTLAILEDYFSKYTYSDTILSDSLQLVINDTVSMNRIQSRDISYKMLYPTKTITTTIEKYLNRREFYAGFAVNGSTNGFEAVGADFIFRTKRDMTYRAFVGVNNRLGVEAGFGMHWRLKLMK